MKKVGAHLTISVWHLLIKLKTNYLLKNVLKWAKCTINHNHMRYGSWDTVKDNFFCHLGPFFALLSPLTTRKIEILKTIKKHLEVSSFYIYVYQKSQSYDVCFLGHFLPFTPLTTPKIKILKKCKKDLEISSFYPSIP